MLSNCNNLEVVCLQFDILFVVQLSKITLSIVKWNIMSNFAVIFRTICKRKH